MTTHDTFPVTIYHNPDCGTSRNTLALIRHAGIEPTVIEYLKTPPTREVLIRLVAEAMLHPREAVREKGTPYAKLGLGEPGITDEVLIDAMLAHPILINRPFVVTPRGTRLCRPSETVLDILPAVTAPFTKEDGEVVIDNQGRRLLGKIASTAANGTRASVVDKTASDLPVPSLPDGRVHPAETGQ